MDRTTSMLRQDFKTLHHAMRSLDKTLQKLVRSGARVHSNASPRRKTSVSPKRRAALVLQGRYMGYMRQLKPKQKAQVRILKESSGVRSAIVQARRLVEKGR